MDYLSIPIRDRVGIDTQDFLSLWLIIDYLSGRLQEFCPNFQKTCPLPVGFDCIAQSCWSKVFLQPITLFLVVHITF